MGDQPLCGGDEKNELTDKSRKLKKQKNKKHLYIK